MPARFQVAASPVHGRGVFATRDIADDEYLLDYAGEIISWAAAAERYAGSDAGAGHTYFFDLGDDRVIDGGSGGNSARFINHACAPNCAAYDEDGRITIYTIRPIERGEELFIDYALYIDEPSSAEERAAYACRCGTPACRGTMLADTDSPAG